MCGSWLIACGGRSPFPRAAKSDPAPWKERSGPPPPRVHRRKFPACVREFLSERWSASWSKSRWPRPEATARAPPNCWASACGRCATKSAVTACLVGAVMSMNESSMIATSMTEALGRFLDVDVARYKLVSTNLANIDTPGYRTRDLDFRVELAKASQQSFAAENGLLTTAAFTPVARQVRGLVERPDGNNVSVERESLLLAETQIKFNLGIQLLKDQFHTISLAINSGGGTSS